jgi:hypothetical protein
MEIKVLKTYATYFKKEMGNDWSFDADAPN